MSEKPKPDLNLDRFEQWHEIVDSNIQDFLTTLDEPTKSKLDYSKESLSVVGNWLVKQYRDGDNPIEGQNRQRTIHYGAIYYVGEVYRKYLEGHWNIHFKELEPDYEYAKNL